jgi:hypothetical protein
MTDSQVLATGFHCAFESEVVARLHLKALIISTAILMTGCTAVTVRPASPDLQLMRVCIQNNPRVAVSDFVSVLRDGFDRHGIATEVISGAPAERCDAVLTYTAQKSWDMAPYLSVAEIRLERDGRQLAYAEYHLRGKGGLSLAKWEGTKSKIDPVIDELLKGYKQ